MQEDDFGDYLNLICQFQAMVWQKKNKIKRLNIILTQFLKLHFSQGLE